ncbi:nucleoside triphosphate pyrophosphohydrolase [Edwardsiella phage PEi20]|uniref:NTP pyrophosphohydrolase MazG putative catalytic core domain-containing protein n=2 Tax=Kanagawavirus pei20 TaxID=2844109 RepID=A0A0B6VRD1_9CAUD|nr:nucleoside triphosphate pyrophosphohydrolase [Edwardsiella phage PEi20]BAQ22678.1 conserved hypothetical protein [Edwardsiella phage PEi20]BAQ22979.1 conserved hypothetical protein [Edwardsiella phage PEi26]
MNQEQHAFLKLGEECNEVAMLCSKIMQFGLDSEYEGKTNRQRLTEELNDIMGCLLNLRVETDFDFVEDREAVWKKFEKMERFRKISEQLGFVAPSTK